jgi:hypothetical protein
MASDFILFRIQVGKFQNRNINKFGNVDVGAKLMDYYLRTGV